MALLAFCVLLMVGSLGLSMWRKKSSSPNVKKLSRSWATASFWFGLTGLIFVVARVEQIQFLAMRIWWVIWLAIAIFYVVLQAKFFRARHYEVLPTETVIDPRAKYLPRKKK